MSNLAIRVDGLSKKYKIGLAKRHDTLRDAIMEALTSIFRLNGRGLAYDAQCSAASADTIWALKDVSFEIKHGEVVGFIGRNGAGKSTLLKILSRITAPTEGRAEIHGRVGSLLEVGSGFHGELTGRENLYLNGAILGMKKAEIGRKFDEIVAFAEVEKFIDTPVKHYSSGMYVRLAFAVAAHLEPEILIVDEVLAVGDAAFQKKCLGKMGRVAKEGRTVLFVSHNIAAVSTLCDRTILLHQGCLLEDDTTPRVVSAYLNSGHVSRAEVIWDDQLKAPGDELFRLRSVRVRGEGGSITSEIDSRHPFDVEIEYWNLCAGSRLGTTLVLYNQEGVCVFSSLSNQETKWHGRSRPEGLFRSVCHVPGNLLADGHFSVSVLLWTDNYRSIYRKDEVVEFEIQETSGRRGDYFGIWSGVVRPCLQWDTEYLGEGAALLPLTMSE